MVAVTQQLGEQVRIRGGHEASQVDVEARLQRRVLEEVGHHGLGPRTRLQLDDDAHFVGALVTHIGGERKLLVGDVAADALNECGLVHREGNLADDDVVPPSLALGAPLALERDGALSRCVDGRELLSGVQDHTTRREVGPLELLAEPVSVRLGVVDEQNCCIDGLPQVVRGNAGGHANGDAPAPLTSNGNCAGSTTGSACWPSGWAGSPPSAS